MCLVYKRIIARFETIRFNYKTQQMINSFQNVKVELKKEVSGAQKPQSVYMQITERKVLFAQMFAENSENVLSVCRYEQMVMQQNGACNGCKTTILS